MKYCLDCAIAYPKDKIDIYGVQTEFLYPANVLMTTVHIDAFPMKSYSILESVRSVAKCSISMEMLSKLNHEYFCI